jgi:cytoskeletal protein CcmA (bactofilin family)
MQSAKKQPVLGRTLDTVIRFTSSIGEGTTFTGSFSGGENIVVRGTVHGESDVQGAIVVANGGHWVGHLQADIVVVAGRVDGDITAREKIEVLNGAHIKGNMASPVIAMETGSIHDGRISMHSNLNTFAEKRQQSS